MTGEDEGEDEDTSEAEGEDDEDEDEDEDTSEAEGEDDEDEDEDGGDNDQPGMAAAASRKRKHVVVDIDVPSDPDKDPNQSDEWSQPLSDTFSDVEDEDLDFIGDKAHEAPATIPEVSDLLKSFYSRYGVVCVACGHVMPPTPLHQPCMLCGRFLFEDSAKRRKYYAPDIFGGTRGPQRPQLSGFTLPHSRELDDLTR